MSFFPNNEFWQCPSYTWSSIVLGLIVSIIISLAFLINDSLGTFVANVGSLFLVFWILRTVLYWVNPNPECEARGYPGQHYANPFYKPPAEASW